MTTQNEPFSCVENRVNIVKNDSTYQGTRPIITEFIPDLPFSNIDALARVAFAHQQMSQ
jgi:hypothetical protein